MTEQSKKTCPIMSRPAPYLYSVGEATITNFGEQQSTKGKRMQGYSLMEVLCLESRCRLWVEACKDSDCDKCMMRPETEEERNNCHGRAGRCSMGRE